MNLALLLSIVTLFVRIKSNKSGANLSDRQRSVVHSFSRPSLYPLAHYINAARTTKSTNSFRRFEYANSHNTDPVTYLRSTEEGSGAAESINTTDNNQPNTTDQTSTTTEITTTLDPNVLTPDPNSDSDDQVSSSNLPGVTDLPADLDVSTQVPKVTGSDRQANGSKPNDASKNIPKPGVDDDYQPYFDTLKAHMSLFIEKVVLFYAIFIVYISVVKIVYSNILFVRDHVTEQG